MIRYPAFSAKERNPLDLHGLLVSGALTTLSSQPEDVDPQSINELERFIIVMYSRIRTLSRVDEARKQLFTQGFVTIENISPTKATLF